MPKNVILFCSYARRQKHERVEAREPQSGWAAPLWVMSILTTQQKGKRKLQNG